MYNKILIPLDNSPTDKVILAHIQPLAALCKSELVLVHVADGFVARNQHTLNLAESEEMREDRRYLEETAEQLSRAGFSTSYHLRLGDPAPQILEVAALTQCDLIAMATHGHRFLKDLVLGSVADSLRHATSIPMLMVRDSGAVK